MTATDATIVRRDPQHAVTRKTGPNDAKPVVWAISMCFFFLISFFFYSFIYTGTIGATEILLGYD